MVAGVMILFLVMLVIGVPIAVCMGLTAAAWLLVNPEIPGMLVASKMYAQMDNFAMLAVPFFMLAGQVMERTGITDGLVDFANSIVGHIRGGLSHTACLTGMLMAGISGSGQADTAAIGNVLIPALKKDGYEEGYAVSVVASAGGLGPIIPPSIFFIYYANATQYSVGKLFMGGMIPGILMGIGFMVIGYFYARKRQIPLRPFAGFGNIWRSFKRNVFVLFMPCIIVFGILLGVFTPTEAGVVAALYEHQLEIIYGEAGQYIMDLFEQNTNTTLIGWYISGSRNVMSTVPINNLAEAKDVIIRVPEVQIYNDCFKLLDMAPTPLAYSEMYTGLQTGVVEACECPLPALYDGGYGDVAPNLCLTGHMFGNAVIAVNSDYWNSLPAEYQTILVECFDKLKDDHNKQVMDMDAGLIENFKADGVYVSEISDLDSISDKLNAFYDDFAENLGPDAVAFKDLILDCAP